MLEATRKLSGIKFLKKIFHVLELEFLVIILKMDMSFMMIVIMDSLVNQSFQELLFGMIAN